ncbi:tyrosine-protein phosphatase [Candidatus Enterococcus clewellii]|uniref:Protein-tyrosine phosphatase n=1 Tax=Candidatus Enterococcus clewellii TaxID=1834193 RepID=A0AAQ3Y173_9ENTE
MIEEQLRELKSLHEVVLEGTFNFRDIGGYKGVNNKKVKTGLFFRSDDLSQLTEHDCQRLVDMELRTIFDYRNQVERQLRPNKEVMNTQTLNYSPKAEVAVVASAEASSDQSKVEKLNKLAKTEQGRKMLVDRQMDMSQQMRDLVSLPESLIVYRALVNVLRREEQLPMVQHCHGGKDRTGWGSVILLMIFGVSDEDIKLDYLLTRAMNGVRNQRRLNEYKQYTEDRFVLDYLYSLMDTRIHYLESGFDEMFAVYGSKENYLIEGLGLSKEEIQLFQQKYMQ